MSRLLRRLTACLLLSCIIAWSFPAAHAASDRDFLPVDTPESHITRMASVAVAGKKIDYKTMAGSLIIANKEGRHEASVFYVAYVATKPTGGKSRPVTFIFNGGPGAPSSYLHLESIAPIRLDWRSDAVSIKPNPHSFIDRSDLVFIDAVGTGLSRRLDGVAAATFQGVDEDIAAFAKAISRWAEINNRKDAPIFIMGESYGGRRAAGLAIELPKHGLDLHGIIMISGGLSTAIRDPYNDLFYVKLLPSYAATAWYHKRGSHGAQTLDQVLKEAKRFADEDYLLALGKGHDLSDADRDRIAHELSGFTGLSVPILLKYNLRVDVGTYSKELLIEKHELVGQLDSRVTGADPKPDSATAEADPSWNSLSTRIQKGIEHYLYDELNYDKLDDLAYRPVNRAAQSAWRWTRRDGRGFYPWNIEPVTADLAEAMTDQPKLKVLALMGYYDLAVPYAVTEYDLSHLRMPDASFGNIDIRHFPAGHGLLSDPAALTEVRPVLDRFYDEALRPEIR